MLFQGGDAHFVIAIANYVQKQEFSYSKYQQVSKINKTFLNQGGNSKNSRKIHKTQGKTQDLGAFCPA